MATNKTTLKTEEGKKVEPISPAIPEGAEQEHPETEKVRVLSHEEQEELIGELEPGEEGYLPLDEKGNITGPAKKGKPPEGTLGASVVAPADTRPPALMTPSGAPITARMSPSYPESGNHGHAGTHK